jgi:transcriptional regulator with XRE-family HTH domain
MPKSQLLKFRKKKKLSIDQLCELTKLDKYQHIVYEASIHPIPVDIAAIYCKALDITFEELFPGFKRLIKGMTNSEIEDLLTTGRDDQDKLDQMLKIGLELDSCRWIVQVTIASGHLWVRDIPAASARHIQDSAYSGFSVIAFDTHHSRVAMHSKGVSQIQVLFESNGSIPIISDEELIDQPSPDDWEISVFTNKSKDPIRVRTEEYPSDDYENLNPLQEIFYYIDLSPSDLAEYYEYAWLDIDGELIWFSNENMAVFEVPLGFLENGIGTTMGEIYDQQYGAE